MTGEKEVKAKGKESKAKGVDGKVCRLSLERTARARPDFKSQSDPHPQVNPPGSVKADSSSENDARLGKMEVARQK